MSSLQNIKIPPDSTVLIYTAGAAYSTLVEITKYLIIKKIKKSGGIAWNVKVFDNQIFNSKNSTFPPIPPGFILIPTKKQVVRGSLVVFTNKKTLLLSLESSKSREFVHTNFSQNYEKSLHSTKR